MKHRIGYSLLFVALLAAVCAGYFWKQEGDPASRAIPGTEEGAGTAAAEDHPVVAVRTVAITLGTIQQELTAYGTVISQPGEMRVISAPFESRVVHVSAVAGQPVSSSAPLVKVEASPDTRLQWEEANQGVTAATRQLQLVEQRYEQRLATKQERFQAQQDLQSAQVKRSNLEKRGVASPQNLVAEQAGIVSKVVAQEGQIVPAGAALVELAVENRIEVKLGIEPEDVAHLKVDQPVSLSAVDRDHSAAITGKLRLVTGQVNPDTRLVDVFVSLPSDAGLLLNQYVRGQLAIAGEQALVVPREAVRAEQGGYALFTIEKGRALKHAVTPGFQSAGRVAVRGDGLKQGQRVVVTGNYELTNGMAVTEADGP